MNASVIKTHVATATDGEQEGAEGGGGVKISKQMRMQPRLKKQKR